MKFGEVPVQLPQETYTAVDKIVKANPKNKIIKF